MPNCLESSKVLTLQILQELEGDGVTQVVMITPKNVNDRHTRYIRGSGLFMYKSICQVTDKVV